jgi:putative DNA primase/helicase
LRQDDDQLIVPMYGVDQKLSSVQRIRPDGRKQFLADGRVGNCYFAIEKSDRDPGETICIADCYATAATIHEIAGHRTYVAFSCYNMKAVARMVRHRYPDKRIVICGDDDWKVEGNPGVTRAWSAARAVKGFVALPQFKADRADIDVDFNDMCRSRGADAVKRLIDGAIGVLEGRGAASAALSDAVDSDEVDERIVEASKLPRLKYERVRKPLAKELGVRTSALDEEVERVREEAKAAYTVSRLFDWWSVEPWPEPVDTGTVLRAVTERITRHVANWATGQSRAASGR